MNVYVLEETGIRARVFTSREAAKAAMDGKARFYGTDFEIRTRTDNYIWGYYKGGVKEFSITSAEVEG